MSQNAPGRKTTDLGPNPSGRTQGAPELPASVPGAYDHEGGHPERIRRRREFAPVIGPALRKEPCSRKVDKCGTVFWEG